MIEVRTSVVLPRTIWPNDPRAISSALEEMGRALLPDLQNVSPVGDPVDDPHSGLLRASWQQRTEAAKDWGSLIFENTARDQWGYYPYWVHEGTGVYGPYGQPIRPVRARYMVFRWKGEWRRMRRVRGQPGQKFLVRFFEAIAAKLPVVAYWAFASAMRRLNRGP